MLDLKAETNYLHRLTTLFGMADLSQVVTSEAIRTHFVPVLQQMSKDKIPNIRMNVAKTIISIRDKHLKGPCGPAENAIESDLLGILNELKNDDDEDVKFFTKKAISLRK